MSETQTTRCSRCSTCGTMGTNKSTCPNNPKAKNPDPSKHSCDESKADSTATASTSASAKVLTIIEDHHDSNTERVIDHVNAKREAKPSICLLSEAGTLESGDSIEHVLTVLLDGSKFCSEYTRLIKSMPKEYIATTIYAVILYITTCINIIYTDSGDQSKDREYIQSEFKSELHDYPYLTKSVNDYINEVNALPTSGKYALADSSIWEQQHKLVLKYRTKLRRFMAMVFEITLECIEASTSDEAKIIRDDPGYRRLYIYQDVGDISLPLPSYLLATRSLGMAIKIVKKLESYDCSQVICIVGSNHVSNFKVNDAVTIIGIADHIKKMSPSTDIMRITKKDLMLRLDV